MRLVGFDFGFDGLCSARVMHASFTKTDRFTLLMVSVVERLKEEWKTLKDSRIAGKKYYLNKKP